MNLGRFYEMTFHTRITLPVADEHKIHVARLMDAFPVFESLIATLHPFWMLICIVTVRFR